MATPMIEIRDLVKQYGAHPALRGVSFSVNAGEVVGFLGPNGAGKSTTLRIITGYLQATAGEVTVDGLDVRAAGVAARTRLGYLPESTPLYPEMRVDEYLGFRGGIKGLDRARRAERIAYVAERCGLAKVRRQIIGTLSRGYRQRVGLADALLADPPLIILDEPTVGLDPNQIREVRTLIRELAGNHTVLLSTHILPEVEAVCDRVVIINRGSIVAEGTPAELDRRLRGQDEVVLVLRDAPPDTAARLQALPGVSGVRPSPQGALTAFTLTAHDSEATAEAVFRAAAAAGWTVRELRPHRAALEEIFAQLTVNAPAESAPATEVAS